MQPWQRGLESYGCCTCPSVVAPHSRLLIITAALQVASICQEATECWWRDNHSGWMIYARGKRHFETLDQVLGHAQEPTQPPQPPQWDPRRPPAQVSFCTICKIYSGGTEGAVCKVALFCSI